MLFQNNLKLNFYGPDQADGLIQNEEAELKKKDEVKDIKKEATDAVNRVKGRLPKAGEDEKSKIDRKNAEDKINAAQAKFEAALALAKRNIELKAAVAAIKPDKDFLNAVEKFAPLEKERDVLKAAGLPEDTSVDNKKLEIRRLAKVYYDGVASKLDKELAIASKDLKDEVVAMMTAVSELQQAKFNKYPGLDDGTNTKAYDAKIVAAVNKIEANAASVNDPEFAASLKRFKFAQTNLAGAESSGAAAKESGHLAGAEQYMAMVLAEQEARRVWASLPKDNDLSKSWRGDKIGDDLDTSCWSKDGDNYKNYVAAQKDFNQALALASINKDPGDSYKATNLFKSAADKWRLVVEKAEEEREKKAAEKKDAEKKDAEKSESKAKTLKDKLSKTTARKLLEKDTLKDYDDAIAKMTGNLSDYVGAKGLFDKAFGRFEGIEKDYVALTNSLSDKLQGGVDQVVASGVSNKETAGVIIYGWVNDIYKHLNSDQKIMWDGLTAINYVNTEDLKMEVWVSTMGGGGVRVDTSGHLRKVSDKVVGDQTVDDKDKTGLKNSAEKAVNDQIDAAIKYYERLPIGEGFLSDILKDYVQDAYRYGDGPKDYPRNFDMAKGVLVAKDVVVTRGQSSYKYKVTAGRDNNGQVVAEAEYVGGGS